MCSGDGNWTLLQLGFPIRTSPDHSSVVNFPGLIADSYVLLRLLMPRHPPCALSSLSFLINHKIATKMLASTMQFSRYGRYLPRRPRTRQRRAVRGGGGPKDEAPRRSNPSGPNSVPDCHLADRLLSTPPLRTKTRGWLYLPTGEPGEDQIADVPLNEPCCTRRKLVDSTLDRSPGGALPTAP
jgi:hypothetical protein